MVKITSFEESFFYPAKKFIEDGLEEIVRFPDGEYKSEEIPNSTIWRFNKHNHQYQSNIHKSDTGCGITAFVTSSLDHKEAADTLYHNLKGKKILGRGNHFIDICSRMDYLFDGIDEKEYNIILIHTHGTDHSVPKNFKQAIIKQREVSDFRINLGYQIGKMLGVDCKLFGDYAHNTVEETENHFIYRKGVVKVKPEQIYFLPANLGSKILVYTIHPSQTPPEFSMPHATGRKGARGLTKVSLEKAAEIRSQVYIPEGISNSSLRTEHPSCFNNFDKIYQKLKIENDYFTTLGQTKILSYVGKV